MGTTVLVGHGVGAKNEKTAVSALGNSIWLFIILAFILTPIMVLGSNPISMIMNTPDEAVLTASTYVRICGMGVPFIIAYNVISAILHGDGNSYVSMLFIGIACVVRSKGEVTHLSVCDSRGSRQMYVQARPLGSLLAEFTLFPYSVLAASHKI